MSTAKLLMITAALVATAPANAIVGGVDARRTAVASRHVVMIVSTRGSLCTGTVLASDIVLTAGHCVAPAASYRVLTADRSPPGFSVNTIMVNPRYNPKDYASGRVTADVALLKLSAPLPADVAPVTLAPSPTVQAGDRFIITGYGTTNYGNETGIGAVRAAEMVATGRPGNLQIRLVDPSTRGERRGSGACTGDSGGPVFIEIDGKLGLVGVISWSTGPNLSEGCGGMTGVTPLTLHRSWIIATAAKLGSPILE
jgi:secreted trypsin-like serine protease